MSIRLRRVGQTLVALCAAETDHAPGDLYLDDAIHHALAVKFAADWEMPWRYPEEEAIAETQKLRDAAEEILKWDRERAARTAESELPAVMPIRL